MVLVQASLNEPLRYWDVNSSPLINKQLTTILWLLSYFMAINRFGTSRIELKHTCDMAISKNLIARAGGIVLLFSITVPAATLLLALQRGAAVTKALPLDSAEIAQIEQLLIESAPGNVRNSELRKLSLSNHELNLLLRYATELIGGDSGINGRIYLPGQILRTEVSVPISNLIRPLWLNFSAEFISVGDRLQLSSLKLGHLGIPSNLVEALASRVENQFLGGVPTYIEILALLDSVQRIDIAEDQLNLDFMWEPSLIAQVRNQAQQLLVSDSDQILIARHYENLAQITNGIPATTRAIPLTTLLAPLFASALNQSRLGSDPIAENRALFLALAAYVNEEDMNRWLQAELVDQLPQPRLIEVRIQRRQDLAQHVISSAAIAASAGAGVAQIISNIKENYDARYRTGFSFSDLTANTAGMTIGSLATESRELALEMQHRLSRLESDSEYLPVVSNNRDGLSESDLNALFGQQSSAEYQERIGEIESLIYQQSLFEGLATN